MSWFIFPISWKQFKKPDFTFSRSNHRCYFVISGRQKACGLFTRPVCTRPIWYPALHCAYA